MHNLIISFIILIKCSFAVDLQQTSPSPVCPGDDVILACTVTVPSNQSLILIWFNPNNNEDRKLYIVNDTDVSNDPVVGSFTTELVGYSSNTIISTATVQEINFTDAMQTGINCFDSIGNNETMYITGSGRK